VSNQYNHIGIECTIAWFDSPDITYGAVILFGDAPDTDDQDDDNVFYYLDSNEEEHLYKCISERREVFACGDEWYIDLLDGYGLIVGK
jgi:hypothetical protein